MTRESNLDSSKENFVMIDASEDEAEEKGDTPGNCVIEVNLKRNANEIET